MEAPINGRWVSKPGLHATCPDSVGSSSLVVSDVPYIIHLTLGL
jgi:hypothetical protein